MDFLVLLTADPFARPFREKKPLSKDLQTALFGFPPEEKLNLGQRSHLGCPGWTRWQISLVRFNVSVRQTKISGTETLAAPKLRATCRCCNPHLPKTNENAAKTTEINPSNGARIQISNKLLKSQPLFH